MSSARRAVRAAAVLAALVVAACESTVAPDPRAAPSAPVADGAAPLFYSKGGSLYVSAPAGSPGRKLTDGPYDEQPAPSPDLTHVAFVRKATATDYGGQLWVLDLSPQLTPAAPPRRLVEPEYLPQGRGATAQVAFPRWSPTGGQVAFIDSPTNGAVPGGILLVAAADTGELEPRQRVTGADWEPFAGPAYAWAPDGSHIAWLNQRSDVRPTNVNALAAVGGQTVAVAVDTNASSVAYAKDSQAILFSNAQAPPGFSPRAFSVRTGGIYSIPAGATPPWAPTALFTREGSQFSDVAVLESGAVAFSSVGADGLSRTVHVLDKGSSVPRTAVDDAAVKPICLKTPTGGGACHGVQQPAWGAGDLLAYLDTSPERSLVVTDPDNRDPQRVDTGVETFAWAP